MKPYKDSEYSSYADYMRLQSFNFIEAMREVHSHMEKTMPDEYVDDMRDVASDAAVGLKQSSTLNDAAYFAAKKWHTSIDEMRGPCRKTNVINARTDFVLHATKELKQTHASLGRYLQRDPSTINNLICRNTRRAR